MKRLIKLAKALSSLGLPHSYSILKLAGIEIDKDDLLYAILKGEELSDSESQVLQSDSLKKFLVEMGGEIKEFPIEGHGNYFLVKLDSKSYVFDLESLDEKKLTTQEWCQSIADWGDVDDYIDYVHFDIPSQVFHATGEENKESILEKGIKIRSDSRGISNRYLSDSVFTSSEPGEIDSYGSLVFKIDLAKMLADGVISKQDLSQEPDVVRYEKLRALEHLFDLEYGSLGEDMEYGMSPHTVIISSSIPPEYLSVFE